MDSSENPCVRGSASWQCFVGKKTYLVSKVRCHDREVPDPAANLLAARECSAHWPVMGNVFPILRKTRKTWVTYAVIVSKRAVAVCHHTH